MTNGPRKTAGIPFPSANGLLTGRFRGFKCTSRVFDKNEWEQSPELELILLCWIKQACLDSGRMQTAARATAGEETAGSRCGIAPALFVVERGFFIASRILVKGW